ncbi:MAG: outer membrane beta-barrel protein [Bacteroidia bacterium]
MKSRLGLAVILLFLCTNMYAQLGFKIGPQVSFITSRSYVIDSLPNNYNFRFKSGVKLGLTAQYGFTQKFVLASGISFTNKGYRVFNDTNNTGNLIKNNLSHIEVPINMIFKLRVGSSAKMRFLIGGALNYQLNNKEVIELNNGSDNFIIRETSENKIYPMGSVGIEIASESKSGNIFVFGAYYNQSFSNQAKLNIFNANTSSNEKVFSLGYRGSYIGLGLTYLFDLKNFKKEEVFFY